MNTHRYILEPYKGMNTRYDCPGCGKRKTFTRYIDTKTGEHLAAAVGRCNREVNCGYHYTPKQYFQEYTVTPVTPCYSVTPVTQRSSVHSVHDVHTMNTVNTVNTRERVKSASYIPIDIFKKSLTGFEANHFIEYLLTVFDADTVRKLIETYFIGTSKHWTGATVFWQIDIHGRIRAGKIMAYGIDGHRIKEPYNHITWAHKALKLEDFNLAQCFFGEHLLKGEPTKPVAVVESEKTAIIASAYLPKFIWLACGSLSNLSPGRCKPLAGRHVVLFPDLNGFEKWSAKAKELSHIATFTVSDLLERKATEIERMQGLDIADYLTRFDYRTFTGNMEPVSPDFEPLTFSDVLDVHQALHEIEARGTTIPADVWADFWNICHNRADGVAWRKLIQFISLN